MSVKVRTSGLWRGDFLKNVSLVMSGAVVSQLATLVAAPVLTRIYPAEAMGVFSIYASVVAVLSVAAALRYELAIVLPRDEREADELFILSCLAVLAVTALTCAAVGLAGRAAAERFGVPALAPWLAWIPATVLAVGLYQNLNYWCTRQSRFRQVSVSQALRSGIAAAIQLAAGAAGLGAAGLIGGHLAGQSGAAAALGMQNGKRIAARLRPGIRWRNLGALARRYAEFPAYSMPQSLLNALSQNLPVFLLAFFYGAKAAGYYAISYRILQMPVTLVSQSVRQVFLQQASEACRNGRRPLRMFAKLTLTLALIAALPTVAVFAFGPPLFAAVLGPQWGEAGQYARWMALWLFFAFVNPPATVLSTVYGMQRMLLVYEMLLLAFRFGALYAGGRLLPPVGCVMLYSVVGAAFNLFLILHVRQAAGKRAAPQAAFERAFTP
jgi:O-antigen/teichoic acid export membrane protein